MRKNTLLYFVILTTFFLSACIIKGRVVDGNGVGVAGVRVTLSGDDSMTATTNSNGDYQLGTLAHMVDVGSYIITPSKSGCTFDPASTNVPIINGSLGDLDVPWPVDAKDFVAVCSTSGAVIIDHNCTDITRIPQSAIEQAKSNLHIAYGHTSHGSQLTTGMDGLVSFANGSGLGLSLPTNIFAWDDNGAGGALDLDDYFVEGDLGYPDRTTWERRTRTYLDNPANSDVNVVIWSWCGQVADASENDIDSYLSLMSQLELDYPDVHFVYMTGHADGSGELGNVHLRNQQIRTYCETNDKILYDFYDIECYDPDGNYFGDKNVDDACNYTGGNWATEWQNSHDVGIDWYDCESAHSEPLNANRKAYAAWWLWARLAGWNP